MEKAILNKKALKEIKPYYPILCDLAVALSIRCTKGETISCNTPCAEITFKIK